MTNKARQVFSPLVLRRRHLVDPQGTRYRLYGEDASYTLIEAQNAAEAFRLSGVQALSRIVREAPSAMALIDQEGFVEAEEQMPLPLPEFAPELESLPVISAPKSRPVGLEIIVDLSHYNARVIDRAGMSPSPSAMPEATFAPVTAAMPPLGELAAAVVTPSAKSEISEIPAEPLSEEEIARLLGGEDSGAH